LILLEGYRLTLFALDELKLTARRGVEVLRKMDG